MLISTNIYSQNRLFSLWETDVQVGDSCYVYPLWAMCRSIDCPETISLCDSIREFMYNNPTVIIEIQSHTDCRPTPLGDTLSIKMSDRLKTLVLMNSNLDSTRIIAIGFGGKSPRIVTSEIHSQHDFLPVGKCLTEAFIRSIENFRQREVAHSFNRRTIIKIVGK